MNKKCRRIRAGHRQGARPISSWRLDWRDGRTGIREATKVRAITLYERTNWTIPKQYFGGYKSLLTRMAKTNIKNFLTNHENTVCDGCVYSVRYAIKTRTCVEAIVTQAIRDHKQFVLPHFPIAINVSNQSTTPLVWHDRWGILSVFFSMSTFDPVIMYI